MSRPDCIEHVIDLPYPVPSVLAMGAWFKNTLCITLGTQAFVSRSVGDLDSPDACREHEQIARSLLAHLPAGPQLVLHDLHPDFHSSHFGQQLAAELSVPCVGVQHHHAHIAAVCAEQRVDVPVLGLALDGVGLGTDGHAWGGELLRVDGATFERVGHLRPLPLAGGDRAAREPWRMAAGVLHELGRGEEIASRFCDEPAAQTVHGMLQRDFNCPRSSSMGRLFDAAAGLLELNRKMAFEAEAAIILEQAATRHIARHGWPQQLENCWRISPDGELDLLPVLARLADITEQEAGAALFHATVVAALAEWVDRAAWPNEARMLACGGGCFFNALLSSGLREQCDEMKVRMLRTQTLSAGDTAISLGQAWVGIQQLIAKESK